MRLINTDTLELEEFVSSEVAPPAQKKGLSKIQSACRQASRDGYTHIWVDTNCIDKSSSAELSEAINSMFAWYQEAALCYVYMADVPPSTYHMMEQKDSSFRNGRWFTRGWTLQELIAPRLAVFYADDCRVPAEFSIAQIMSWASTRTTTRTEDLAYCLLGLFGVNMPLLFGEGPRAFLRLQQELIKISDDRSIFAFDSASTPLATSPTLFSRSRHILPRSLPIPPHSLAFAARHAPARDDMDPVVSFYQMTNAGLSNRMPLVPTLSDRLVLGVLDDVLSAPNLETACILLSSHAYKYRHQYNRVTLPFSWTSIHIRSVTPTYVPDNESSGSDNEVSDQGLYLSFSPGTARDILISSPNIQQRRFLDDTYGGDSRDEYVAIYLEAAMKYETIGENFNWPRRCRVLEDWKPNVPFEGLIVPGCMTEASWVGSTWVGTSTASAIPPVTAPETPGCEYETKPPAVVVVRIIFDTYELAIQAAKDSLRYFT
ncbi:het domain-containing protein [Colletotrichum sojae]|uniref:Het domain-containing protein n=1 Tax=Colletotrichum sojae TaxID=2175907 RepID=A0A8H6JAH3_9PEZI|nr:het domain-containing protein [Colletotrichum sojae]